MGKKSHYKKIKPKGYCCPICNGCSKNQANKINKSANVKLRQYEKKLIREELKYEKEG